MTIGELIKNYNGELRDKWVRGIAFDTAMIQKGDLFFALCGKNFNGNDYINEAIKKVEETNSSEMQKVTGNVSIPGMF